MAVTTDPFVAADLAATIPEVWTGLVQEELFAKTCGANFFLDLSSYASAGGDIVHVPGVFTNAFTVQTQSTQGAEITTAGPAMDDITLTIDTHKYIATIVGDKDLAQIAKMYSFNEIYAKKMGGSLATALEASIFGLWSGLTTNSIGDTATVLSDAEIRQGIAALAGGNFPHSELGFFFHPLSMATA